jgi:hypothetical protein
MEFGSAPSYVVRLHIPIADGPNDIQAEFDKWSGLEELLMEEVDKEGLGEVDGNEVGQGEYTIWLYGPDAGRLAAFVERRRSKRKGRASAD